MLPDGVYFYPVGFTSVEGSYMLVWNKGAVSRQDLLQRDSKHVIINEEEVHSLIFNYYGHGNRMSRWDCINGWNEGD